MFLCLHLDLLIRLFDISWLCQRRIRSYCVFIINVELIRVNKALLFLGSERLRVLYSSEVVVRRIRKAGNKIVPCMESSEYPLLSTIWKQIIILVYILLFTSGKFNIEAYLVCTSVQFNILKKIYWSSVSQNERMY